MIITAMIVGYVLGVLPFLFFYAISGQIKINKPIKEVESPENATAVLLDEWLNGATPKQEKEETNFSTVKQEITDQYKELVTGEVSGGTK